MAEILVQLAREKGSDVHFWTDGSTSEKEQFCIIQQSIAL